MMTLAKEVAPPAVWTRRVLTLLLTWLLLAVSVQVALPGYHLATNVARAAAVPGIISGDWNVTSLEEYDSGTAVVEGNITIESGGTLRLHNVTLLINDTHMFYSNLVRVMAGGTLEVVDSLLDAVDFGGGDWDVQVDTGGSLHVEGSELAHYAHLWLSSSDTQLIGTTLREFSDVGLQGVDLRGSPAPLFENLGLVGWSDPSSEVAIRLDLVDAVTFTDLALINYRSGVVSYSGALTIVGGSFESVSYPIDLRGDATLQLRQSTMNDCVVCISIDSSATGPTLSLEDVYIGDVTQTGIEVPWSVGGANLSLVRTTLEAGAFPWPLYGIACNGYGKLTAEALRVIGVDENGVGVLFCRGVTLNNSTIASQQRKGVSLSPSSDGGSDATLINTTYDVLGNGAGGLYAVSEFLDIDVRWQSSGLPIADAVVSIGLQEGWSTSVVTDAMGHAGSVTVPTRWQYGAEALQYGPAIVNVTSPAPNSRSASVTTTVEPGGTALTVIVDDEPPALNVTSPLSGAVIENTTLTVNGSAEVDARVFLNYVDGVHVIPIPTDPLTGAFSALAEVPPTEGPHNITITAIDAAGNGRQVVRVVTLRAPAYLSLYSPDEGALVNDTSVTLSGHADQPGNLTLNGDPLVPYRWEDGFFDATVKLPHEGPNELRLTLMLPSGANTTLVRTVVRDTVAPPMEMFLETTEMFQVGTYASPGPIVFTRYDEVGMLVIAPETTVLTGSITFENGGFYSVSTNGGILMNTFQSLPAGPSLLRIDGVDAAGNHNGTVLTVWFDDIEPDLEILTPEPGTVFHQHEITIRVHSVDDIPWGDSSDTPSAGDISAESADGTIVGIYNVGQDDYDIVMRFGTDGKKSVTIWAKDLQGNSASTTATFAIDTDVPLVYEVRKSSGIDYIIEGQTNPQTLVTLIINNPISHQTRSQVTDDDGIFHLEFPFVGSGSGTLNATDGYGNSQEQVFVITEQRQQAPPQSGDLVVGVLAGFVIGMVVALIVGGRLKRAPPQSLPRRSPGGWPPPPTTAPTAAPAPSPQAPNAPGSPGPPSPSPTPPPPPTQTP